MNAPPASQGLNRIEQISPQEAALRQAHGAVLLDVREESEHAAGMPEGAIAMPRSMIPERIADLVSDHTAIVTICASGQRSLLAAQTLLDMGYQHVASVTGGFAQWRLSGLQIDNGVLDADAAERYSRHLLLPEVGAAGQAKLMAARVALIGAGGLGSPAAMYLAAAGVGTLTLVDDDHVDRSNLQRQILHTDARVGVAKTTSAALTLRALNPRVDVIACEQRIQALNVESLIRDHDTVIDGADNFATRYLLNAACLRLEIPLVYAAVHRFSGQVSVFDPRRADSPCYRCLFPEPPAAADAPNCAQAGVLGVLPGILGLLQASEAIKLLLGIGEPLVGRLLCFDALTARFNELRLPRDPQCPGCGEQARWSSYEDIATQCASQ